MPRDLPIGNGSLLINFDRRYVLRDVYYPHVGQENHTNGAPNRVGIWADGMFSWIGDAGWKLSMRYLDRALVTDVGLEHSALGLRLAVQDLVDFDRTLYLKQIVIQDLRDGAAREVRLFFHFDQHLWGNSIGDTAYFEPQYRSLVHYKARRYFWLDGLDADGRVGLHAWAVGDKDLPGREGTWRDAEDGELSGHAIAQGSVDSVGAIYARVPPQGTARVYFWLAVGQRYIEARDLDALVRERGPDSFLVRTRDYWRLWACRNDDELEGMPASLGTRYHQSLLILRTQIDDGGGIIAANDSDILRFGRDTYSYVWPRDGALVANALIMCGYAQPVRRFFEFCEDVLLPGGYLLHKFNPDRSVGSSWHPWIDSSGKPQLPIQEDETGLVLWALWNYYARFREVEFIKPFYRPLIRSAADFMVGFREPRTGLPAPSYDLWEERWGIHAFTVASVWAGLQAAANFAEAFGEIERASSYRTVAQEMRAAADIHLYDPARSCFLRSLAVHPNGTLQLDRVIDSSVAGLFLFDMYPADDVRILSTMKAVEARLTCRTPVGGLARYENDHYQQVSGDIDRVPGNPWFICTLWLAQWYVRIARAPSDLERVAEVLEWVADHALDSGVLAEQLDPYTAEPLSVSPLTWSHAAFVTTVREYLTKLRALSRGSLAPAST